MRPPQAPTPAVCGAICYRPGCFSEWLSLKLPAHPVGHDQVSPALCPPWTCRLPQLPPPGILSRATSSQDDPASAGRPILPRSLAAVANEGCGQPHQRQATRSHSPWTQGCSWRQAGHDGMELRSIYNCVLAPCELSQVLP